MHDRVVIAEIYLEDLDATKQFASQFAPALKQGDVIALDGTLGAGKTALCRFIIQSLRLGDDVPSPTFNLVQVYESATNDQAIPTIWHMDLYRLKSPEEAFELGIEEAFDTAASLIEWPSRLGPYLPDGFLTLRMDIVGGGEGRMVKIIGNSLWKSRLGNILIHD